MAIDVNISGPWLKRHHWDQIHSSDSLRIQDRLIPLYTTPHEPSTATYASLTTVVPAGTFTKVQLRTADDIAERINGDFYLRGEDSFMHKTDLHPGLNAIVTCQNGQTTAAVLNTTGHSKVIRAGTRYGLLTPHDLPKGCYTMGHSESQAQRMADRAKEAAKARKGLGIPLPRDPKECDLQEREDWVMEQFQLKKSPFLQNPEDLRQAVDVLVEFWDSFSHDGFYGKTHLLKHRIITEDVPPIKCRYRPINPALEPDLRKQLDSWLEHGVIEPANSPWSFNLVAAKKKDGRIRWCVDWRRLNDITKKDSFPMPTVQDSLARLAGSRIFSAIDMQGAFHCVEMDERDREKTAFATPFGSFQQRMLGFGVTNGPPTYC